MEQIYKLNKVNTNEKLNYVFFGGQKMNEISTNVKKNNLIQKIRLSIFKRTFKSTENMMVKYNKQPDYIKNDEDVLNIVIKALVDNIITFENTRECPKGNLDNLLSRFNNKGDLLVKAVNENRYDIIDALKLTFIDTTLGLEKLKDNNTEEYYNNISKIINYLDINSIVALIRGNPQLMSFLKEDLQEEVIGKGVIFSGYNEKYRNMYKKVFGDKYEYENENAKIDGQKCLKYMSVSNQVKYLKSNWKEVKDLFKDLTEEVQIKYVNENPSGFSSMNPNLQLKLAREDKGNIVRMSDELQKYLIKEDINNFRYSKYYFEPRGCLSRKGFHNDENIESICLTSSSNEPSKKDFDKEIEKKLVEKDVNYVLSLCYYRDENGNIDYEKAMQKCINLFKEMYGIEKLCYYKHHIERIYKRCKEWDEIKEDKPEEHPLAELKILFNPQIMKKCPPRELVDFFSKTEEKQDTQDVFRRIIRETYGEKAYGILYYRPKLNVYNINSLEIFNPEVLDNFSTEFVNDLIDYDISHYSTVFLQGIIKDSSKTENFKTYYDIISKVKGENVETIQEAISRFENFNELLENIKGKQLSDEQLENLISALCSYYSWNNVKKIEDLDNYENITNEHIKIRLEQCKDDVKMVAIEEILGISYKDAKEFLKRFDLSENEIEMTELAENEKCLLYTLKFLNDNNDDVIRDFINNAIKTPGIKNPIALYSGIQKAKEKQMEQFNSQFLTKEQMDQTIAELGSNLGNDGLALTDIEEKNLPIYKYIDDNGLEHYVLNGIQFGLLKTDINMKQEIYLYSGEREKDIMKLVKRFLEYEGQRGTSTVSSSFIKSGTQSIVQFFDTIGHMRSAFIYSSPMKAEDILAVANGDNAVSNEAKVVVPNYIYTEKYNELEMTAYGRFYNEVTFFRKHRNHFNATVGRSDRKIMPDFYMGTFTPEIAEILKKYNIPVLEINKELYLSQLQEQQTKNSKEETFER